MPIPPATATSSRSKAGEPTTGSFVAADTGSFEIESHHLEKVIAILNVR